MFDLKYGKQLLQLDPGDLPSPPTILNRDEPPGASDEAEAVQDALAHPIGSPHLGELVSPSDRVVIVVPDLTRAAKSNVVLGALLNELHAAGVSDGSITILFALGMHSPNSKAEKQQIVGRAIASRIRLIDHDARDPQQNVVLGKTSYGTEVAVNRVAAESDKVIVTGTIGYHLFAGFGGGRKSIFPGVAGAKGILTNHMLPLTTVETGCHPAVGPGRLDGNPVHLDMVEAANMVKPCFLVNTVVNSKKKLVRVFAGDLHAAFEEGCRFFDRRYCIRTDRKADFVIASCGGYPKDINLIQTHKTIDYAMRAVREGGVLLVLGACARGLGNDTFLDWFRYDTEEEFAKGLKATYLKGGMNAQTAYLLYAKTRQATIVLFSGLPASAVQRMGMIPVNRLDKALGIVRKELGPDFETHILPHGGYFRVEVE
ncbi:MAG: nickel-dependent lactate racemase [Planctomycetes bacterium]|nr:nickel-dependent lactate racemase [Planctomycetota bacterium]